jgi:2-polyprenyl-6-hydroxyphenyl methylase/3-demethylubiquinone-9 3-methyltransferase
MRKTYVAAWWIAQALKAGLRGRRFSLRAHTKNYLSKRGMSFDTDVHDWLGGYPYESVSPEQLRAFMRALGFAERRSFIEPGLRHGLFGTGCDEYLFARSAESDSA